MDHFSYQQGELCAEQVPLQAIAERFGTPTYVYSRATLERHYRAYDEAFGATPHLVCYAVKANSNIAVLDVLARLGAGFDIVSVGELERVLRAGGEASKVVFSGVGKQAHEMRRALEVGVKCFNVESEAELLKLSAVAEQAGKTAPVSLRVNPDVDAGTHPYISTGLKDNKFGIAIADAERIYQLAASLPGIKVCGIDCHIGSQLTEVAPFLDALERVLALLDRLEAQDIKVSHLDLGGGLGVCYRNETPPEPGTYVSAILERLGERSLELIMEPGRSIAANAGVLLTRVEYLKGHEGKHFAIIDAAMNDLLRPSLYQAWQDIVPVVPNDTAPEQVYDVVGPVCETGDFLGKERSLRIAQGDLLAVRSSGAYGFAMASNYNSRDRAAEIMVDGDRALLVRRRETIDDQLALERRLDQAEQE
ncbi:MAG: diaminopimelate decarboxylase [Oleiphilaceae bacterium]|nr:diaminopimelate decarboxylase [Oleiphilaceae bacterium]